MPGGLPGVTTLLSTQRVDWELTRLSMLVGPLCSHHHWMWWMRQALKPMLQSGWAQILDALRMAASSSTCSPARDRASRLLASSRHSRRNVSSDNCPARASRVSAIAVYSARTASGRSRAAAHAIGLGRTRRDPRRIGAVNHHRLPPIIESNMTGGVGDSNGTEGV